MEPQTNRPVYEVNRALGAGVILHDGMAAGSSSKEPARLADRADTGTHCRSAHGQMAAGHHLDGGGGRSRARDLWRDALFAASVRSEEHTSELQSLMRISYAVFCLKTKKRILTNQSPMQTIM